MARTPCPILCSGSLAGAAFVGSTVAGVAGFGAGVILLPVVAAIMDARGGGILRSACCGNVSRICGAVETSTGRLSLPDGACLGTALGVLLFAGASSTRLSVIIGVFLLAAVPLRRLLMTRNFRVRLIHFGPLRPRSGSVSLVVWWARRHAVSWRMSATRCPHGDQASGALAVCGRRAGGQLALLLRDCALV
jgi:hypothetical protein